MMGIRCGKNSKNGNVRMLGTSDLIISFTTKNMNLMIIYTIERKTRPSFLRGWDISDKKM